MMDLSAPAKLGVKGRGQHPILAKKHRLLVEPGQDLHARTKGREPRRPDEDAPDRCAERRDIELCLEGVDLSAVGVSFDGGVEQPEAGLCRGDLPAKQDRAGTGSEEDPPPGVEPAQPFEPGLVSHQVEQRGALASGEHQAREAGQLVDPPDLPHGDPELVQRPGVGSEVPLECQHPKGPRHHPRVCSFSLSVSWDISIPGMGSPRPRETSATAFASW